jgi:hypothetical protein
MCTKFWLGSLKSDGKIILKWTFLDTGWEGVNFIQLAQDRDQWWDLVNP